MGVFISFSESLDMCLRQSIPILLISLTVLSLSINSGSAQSSRASLWPWSNGTAAMVDFHQNDLLVGTHDPFFWFMIPLIGIVCVGVCTVLNYITLLLTYLLGLALGLLNFRPGWVRHDDRRRQTGPGFLPSSPRRRMITTAILLFLVATLIPYQFAYLVACLVQLATTVRAQQIASDLRSNVNSNFYNYTHSILVLMLWVLPINLPILVVWMHNLTVHWLTPFSSHHNVLSIMPFIVLVETLTTGKMIPRVTSQLKQVTSILLFGISIYAAVYGVSYAYMLHYLVNLVAGWLVIIHMTADSWSISGLTALYEGNADDRKGGKEP
jgi:glycosylphosphatidylinositol deacylase